jgi:hypothetical protein
MEISARVFGVRDRRDFDIFFKRLLKRQNELEERHLGLHFPEGLGLADPKARVRSKKKSGKT